MSKTYIHFRLKTWRREFTKTIQRPFAVRYNAYTQSIDVLTNGEKIESIINELKGDLCIVRHAIDKIMSDRSPDAAGGADHHHHDDLLDKSLAGQLTLADIEEKLGMHGKVNGTEGRH
jgi:hypothetical protein